MQNQNDNTAESYIKQQLEGGNTPQQVIDTLVSNGWQEEAARQAVNSAQSVPPPPSQQTGQPNMTSQTGNTGTPLQVENVQYNMKLKKVRSRVGFFAKLSSVSLWILAIFVGLTLSTILARITDTTADVAGILVFTIALSVAFLPIFIVANKKLREELSKNPATSDDLFFKKIVRSNLYGAAIVTAILVFFSVYSLLAILVLGEEGSLVEAFQPLAIAAAISSIVVYFWPLHAMTNR